MTDTGDEVARPPWVEPDPPERPPVSARKAEWVAYAEAVSGETIDPEAHTKDELIEKYGS